MSWTGVDLDGTLSVWDHGSQVNTIGAPIEKMVQRVKGWLAAGEEVRIVTARVAISGTRNVAGQLDNVEFAKQQREMIQAWCIKHIGQPLRITASKDFHMDKLWDDRAVEVVTNTGMTRTEYDAADGHA